MSREIDGAGEGKGRSCALKQPASIRRRCTADAEKNGANCKKLDHVERGRALCCAVGLGQPRIDDEAIAVLHHQMPHVAEFGLLAGTLAEQASVRVGGREMRVVPALLAVEVALGVAPTATMTFSRRRIAAVLRHKALHAGPSLDQGAIDREVLA